MLYLYTSDNNSQPLFQTSLYITLTLGQADRKKKEKRSTVLILDYHLMFQDLLLSANRCVACFAETGDNGSFIPQRQAEVTDSIRCTTDHVHSHFQLLENTLITKSQPVLWDGINMKMRESRFLLLYSNQLHHCEDCQSVFSKSMG